MTNTTVVSQLRWLVDMDFSHEWPLIHCLQIYLRLGTTCWLGIQTEIAMLIAIRGSIRSFLFKQRDLR